MIVQIETYGIKQTVDTDKDWARFIALDADDQLSTILCERHWMIHLEEMKSDVASRFWNAWNKGDAAEERTKAQIGDKQANHLKAEEMITLAYLKRDWQSSISNETKRTELALFAGEIIDMIVKDRDAKLLRQIADMTETWERPECNRGGEHSEKGRALRMFCKLHAEKRGLPTKSEMRRGLHYANDDKGRESARRCFLKLGLAGLPEGR